jgi:hypothetical protein
LTSFISAQYKGAWIHFLSEQADFVVKHQPLMKPHSPSLLSLSGILVYVCLLNACASSPEPANGPNKTGSTATPPVTKVAATVPATTAVAKPAPAAPSSNPVASTPAPTVAVIPIDFNAQVKPIFVEYCYRCHGLGKQSGGVRLDVEANVRLHVIPGNPVRSDIYRAITSSPNVSDHMPPVSQAQPEDEDLAIIKQWIMEGAKWGGTS